MKNKSRSSKRWLALFCVNILKVNGINLAYDSYGNEKDETILLIAGLGTRMIRWTVP
ncbi:hypothetical protein [Paenibacillus amylolyticus]|uniref:Alpha/beta hydrolase fold protein n=1 Tax=Paenibacillus amylolyticus TaxID=1451 RepID=A0A100VLI5_PAEAM|nr:hypothetical protein [Paenibacillus amylolyticus]GAS82088.1 alpha/beta hydrolase fold protein [Paenibacillus amylolyticus]